MRSENMFSAASKFFYLENYTASFSLDSNCDWVASFERTGFSIGFSLADCSTG